MHVSNLLVCGRRLKTLTASFRLHLSHGHAAMLTPKSVKELGIRKLQYRA